MVRLEDAVLVFLSTSVVVLPLALILKLLQDAALARFCQRCLLDTLHTLVDAERACAVCSLKIKIFRGQASNFTLTQCAHQCEVNSQMQNRVLHAGKCGPHLVRVPDGTLLNRLLGLSTGTGLLMRMPHSTAY